MAFKMMLLLMLTGPIFYQQPFSIAKPTIEITDDQVDNVDTLIEKELGNFTTFSSTLNYTMQTAKKTFDLLEKFVDQAKENIENLNVELKRLDKQDNLYKDEYFPFFNNATSRLRQVRYKLRKLAVKTISKTRDVKTLLADLDKNKDDTFHLVAALKEMKSLMYSSKEILKESYDQYNLTIEAFENLNSHIQIQNEYIRKLQNTESAEYDSWVTGVRAGAYSTVAAASISGFVTADVFGCLGICSTIGNLIVFSSTAATVESTIANYLAELRKFEKMTNYMVSKGKQIDETIKEANSFLNEEIELIVEWTSNVETVDENIESYPVKYLQKYEAAKTIFIEGMDDLQKTAQKFLDRGEISVQEEDIFGNTQISTNVDVTQISTNVDVGV